MIKKQVDKKIAANDKDQWIDRHNERERERKLKM